MITHFDSTDYAVKIAAEVKNWDATKYMLAKEARRRDLNEQFSVAAAQEAVRSPGFDGGRLESRAHRRLRRLGGRRHQQLLRHRQHGL